MGFRTRFSVRAETDRLVRPVGSGNYPPEMAHRTCIDLNVHRLISTCIDLLHRLISRPTPEASSSPSHGLLGNHEKNDCLPFCSLLGDAGSDPTCSPDKCSYAVCDEMVKPFACPMLCDVLHLDPYLGARRPAIDSSIESNYIFYRANSSKSRTL